MNTPAILNPIAAPQGQMPAAKQTDASGSDVSFNQVLSREVAERSSSSETNRATRQENASAPNQPSTKTTSKKSEKDAPKDSGDSAQADSNATAVTPTATAVPVDMLTLVANMVQLSAGKSDIPTATDSKASADIALAVHATLPASKGDLPALADSVGIEKDHVANIDLAAGVEVTKLVTKLPTDGKSIDIEVKDAVPTKQGIDFANEMKAVREPKQPLESVATAKPQEPKSEPVAPALPAAQIDGARTPEIQTTPALAALQQATVHGTQATASHSVDKLTPPVGTPAWDQALGQKIVWMVAGAQQTASLTLNPPDLGPLQVVLNVSNSQANATFIAAQPEVRQALEAAMPKLREMMGDAGIQLGQATVSTGTPNQNGGFAEQTHKPPQSGNQASNTPADEPVRVTRGRTISSGQGLVDTFV